VPVSGERTPRTTPPGVLTTAGSKGRVVGVLLRRPYTISAVVLAEHGLLHSQSDSIAASWPAGWLQPPPFVTT